MSEAPNKANLSAIALAQAVTTFVALMPDPVAIKHQTSDEYAADVRTRELVAVVLAVLVGAGISVVAKSPQPFMFALLASATLAGGSEYLLAIGRSL